MNNYKLLSTRINASISIVLLLLCFQSTVILAAPDQRPLTKQQNDKAHREHALKMIKMRDCLIKNTQAMRAGKSFDQSKCSAIIEKASNARRGDRAPLVKQRNQAARREHALKMLKQRNCLVQKARARNTGKPFDQSKCMQ